MKKTLVSLLILISLLVAIPSVQAVSSQVTDISLDAPVYEVGENINVTTSFSVEFDVRSGYGYTEIMLKNSQNGSALTQYTWLNLVSEYPYVKTWSTSLNPDSWDPGDAMQAGYITVEAFAYDITGGISDWLEESFWVKKSTTNLTVHYPEDPFLDNQTNQFEISLTNPHNSSYSVSNYTVSWVVVKNETTVGTQQNTTNQNGQFTITFDPQLFGHGIYDLFIESNGTEKYEGLNYTDSFCVFDSQTNDTRPPTQLTSNVQYIGNTTGSIDNPNTYANEPILISGTLQEVLSGNPLSHQEINFSIVDTNNTPINSTSLVTNATGEVSILWSPPKFGEFQVIQKYHGNGTTHGSSQNTTLIITVWARNVSILEIYNPPRDLNLSESPVNGVYRVIDTLTSFGIGNLSFQIAIAGFWLPVQESNASGYILYNFILPQNNMSLLGTNHSLRARIIDLQPLPVYGEIQNNSSSKILNGSYSVKVNSQVDVVALDGVITSPGEIESLFVNMTTDYGFPLLFDTQLQLIWDGSLLSEVLLPFGVGNVNFLIPNNSTPRFYNLTIRVLDSNRIYSSTDQLDFNVKSVPIFEWTGTPYPYYFQPTFIEVHLTGTAGSDLGLEWITIKEVTGNFTLAISYLQLNTTGFLIYATQGDYNKTLQITFSGNSNHTNTTLVLDIIPQKIPIASMNLSQSDILLGSVSNVILSVEDLFGGAAENYSIGIYIDQIFVANFSTNSQGKIEIDLNPISNLPLGLTNLEIWGYEGDYHAASFKEMSIYIKQQVDVFVHEYTQNSNEISFILSFSISPQSPIEVIITEENNEVGSWLVTTQSFTLKVTMPAGLHTLLVIPNANLPYVGLNLTYDITCRPASYLQVSTPNILTPNNTYPISLLLTDDNGFSILYGNITLSIFDLNNSLVFLSHGEVTDGYMWPRTTLGEYTLRVKYEDPFDHFSNSTVEMQIKVRFIQTQIDYTFEQQYRVLTINGILLDEQNQTLSNATILIYKGDLLIDRILTSHSGLFFFEYILTTESTNLTLCFMGEGEKNATSIRLQILGVPPSNFSDLEITRVFSIGVFLLSCVTSILSTRKWPKKLEKIKVR
ncbi:MAG: hypothetical protein ACXACA_00800 [Candidatus Ranarchaeia archaeon]|jgi:hypothetical protein